jgi:hypothetical protein
MKIANIKSMVTKAMLATMAAGALAVGTMMVAIPAKANAEQFGVAVTVGYPHPDYRFDRRREIIRHEEFLRARRFDHRYWR